MGKVVKASNAEDPEILVEIADNVQVKVLKAALSDVRAKARRGREELTCCKFLLWTRIVDHSDRSGGGLLIALAQCAAGQDRATVFPPSCPSSTVSLGLDLQGGSYLLLEVQLDQVQKDKTEAMIGDIRAAFRKAHIGYTDLAAHGDTVTVKVSEPARYDEAKKLVTDLNPTMTSSAALGRRQAI